MLELFQYNRLEGFPSMFREYRTSVWFDIDEVAILFAFVLLGVTFFIIILGYGRKKSLCTFIKVSFSILIGVSLMLSNFGQEWEVGSLQSRMPYRAGAPKDSHTFEGEIGVKIGLRSVNVTLSASKGIYYNERFSWTWDQGRFGFGPHAGRLQREFRAAQRKGLPIPILWVVDYFIIDGEGIRFGRFYRTAGWYCHILLWAALPAWILANIFLQSVGRYAAYFTGLIGFLELTSCTVWMAVRNPTPLEIPFEDGILTLSYGSSFWLTFCGGILCIIIACVLIVMDLRYPNTLSAFLGTDILNQYDECVVRAFELDYIRDKSNKDGAIELGKMSDQFPEKDSGVVLLKRRSTAKKAQRDFLRVGFVPVKIPQYDDVYFHRAGSSAEELESATRTRALPQIPT